MQSYHSLPLSHPSAFHCWMLPPPYGTILWREDAEDILSQMYEVEIEITFAQQSHNLHFFQADKIQTGLMKGGKKAK